jgi:alpha-tubulin suppressor-like RCC1 family protein
VNTANGFAIGDDSPTDGIVSSGDTVAYEVNLQFAASAARNVAVTISVPEYLEWRPQGDLLCQRGHFVTATRSGDMCNFRVPAGAVESLTVPLILTARDTGGQVRDRQQASIAVGVVGRPVHAEAHARAVTVVSAPAADVVMTQPPHFALTAENTVEASSSIVWHATNHASGHFLATPVPLTWPGYSPTKGASIAGPWTARLDVSGFPDTTTWTVRGSTVPVRDGVIDLGTNTGEVRVDFALNGPWPYQDEGTTMDYPVRVIVDPASFSVDDVLLNNGTGWQPGDTEPATYSTVNVAVGSHAGRPWANNDFAVARVNRPFVPDGEVFVKNITGPWDSSRTLWEEENRRFSAGSAQSARQFVDQRSTSGQVAPGTELNNRLVVLTHRIPTLTQLVLGDTWNTAEQRFDPGRPVSVTHAGVRVDSSRYRTQWHTEARTPTQTANLNDPGWRTTAPTAAARSMRFIFNEGTIPAGSQVGAGNLEVVVPTTIRADLPLEFDGRSIANTMTFSARAGTTVTTDTFGRSAIVRHPRIPTAVVTNQVTHIAGNQLATGDARVAAGGDEVTYQVRALITGMPTTNAPVNPTIVVDLDRCATNFRNTSHWNAVVTRAAAPGTSGRICADPTSTPARITFSPPRPVNVAWTNRALGNGTIDTITYTVNVATIAPNNAVLQNSAMLSVAQAPLPVSATAEVATTFRDVGAAALRAEYPRTEINQPLIWTGDVLSFSGSEGGGSLDTVIVLPRPGDGVLFGGDYDEDGYTGARASAFSGTYTVADVSFNAEHTSPRAALFITTTPNPGLTIAGSTWIPMTTASPAQVAAATAVRVQVPGGADVSTAQVTITLNPVGNDPGDVYVMWQGRSVTSGVPVPQPFPAAIDVVASEIHGRVWWDDNANGRIEDAEVGIAGVRVTLHRDTAGGLHLMETRTDAHGVYAFERLTQGTYVTVVHRGTQIPTSVTTHYGDNRTVTTTYSHRNRLGAHSTEASTPIRLGLGASQRNVNFGFHNPAPKIALDKSEATTMCTDGICEVTWDVTVTNTGNMPLHDVALHDTMSGDVFGTSVVGLDHVIMTEVSAGPQHSLALDDTGNVWAWGTGSWGRLGNGSGTSLTPVQTVASWGDRRIIAISAGTAHSLALADDGSVWAWGEGTNGRIGHGSAVISATTPVQTTPSWGDRHIIAISAGTAHSLALADDGTVWAWGSGANGRLGHGGIAATNSTPLQTTATWGDRQIIALDAGDAHSLAIATDGSVWAWGNGTNGRLGDGATTQRTTPVQVMNTWGTRRITSVSTATTHSIALADDGTVWAWGDGSNGRLGTGATASQSSPVQSIAAWGNQRILGICTGSAQTMVLAEDSSVWAWGDGRATRFGNPAHSNSTLSTPVPTLTAWGGRQIVSVSTSGPHSLVVDAGGVVWSWGSGQFGALGLGGTDSVRAPQPLSLRHRSVTQVSAGGPHSLALADDGSVWAWGSNSAGRLGDGTTTDNSVPVLVVPTWGTKRVVLVSAGASSAVVTQCGDVYAWGPGFNSPLGDGIRGDRHTPVRVTRAWGNRSIVDIHLRPGTGGKLALASDGTVWAWGSNLGGDLGVPGAAHPALTPVQVTAGWGTRRIEAISGGNQVGFALAHDGTVWAWGVNSSGILGDGTTTNRSAPVQVRATWGNRRIVAISQGVAVASDGTVWTWGPGANGRLGNGTTSASSTTPVQTTTPWVNRTITDISAALNGTMVLLDDGSVWAWGSGANGRLGLGDTVDRAIPTRLDIMWDGHEVHAISNGGAFCLALTSNGIVWSWGDGINGRLGTGEPPRNMASTHATPGLVYGSAMNATPRPWVDSYARLTPHSTTYDEGWVTESIVLAGAIEPGARRTVQISTNALQRSQSTVLVNQAWVDSPDTPIAGLLPPGLTAPHLPNVPAPSAFDARGVPGNPTCNTDATTPQHIHAGWVPGLEDSCDQVPALIPALATPTGSLAGVTWIDANQDGLRQPEEPLLEGATVQLLRGDTRMGELTTAADGSFRWDGLPPGEYHVQFGVSHLDAGDGQTFAFTVFGGDMGSREDSDAQQDTGLSPTVTVAAHQTTYVDAGVVVHGPAISVVKTSPTHGDDAALVRLPDMELDDLDVTFTVTNIGNETLRELTWEDVTVTGPDVTWEDCHVMNALEPGADFTCHGVLTMGNEPAHQNIVTVTGTGISSNRIVDAEDTWTVTITTIPHMLTLPNVGGTHTWLTVTALLALLGATATAASKHGHRKNRVLGQRETLPHSGGGDYWRWPWLCSTLWRSQ